MVSQNRAMQIGKLLRVRLLEARRTSAELCRDLGWEPARLERLLAGEMPLELEDLYDLLAVLEIPPTRFFSQISRPERTASLLEGIEIAHLDPDTPVAEGLSFGSLMEEVRRAVRDELAAPSGGPGTEPEVE